MTNKYFQSKVYQKTLEIEKNNTFFISSQKSTDRTVTETQKEDTMFRFHTHIIQILEVCAVSDKYYKNTV